MMDEKNIFGANILVVDDIETNVMLLEQILHETGYQQVTSTTDPSSVVELHRVNHYDLILLDLQMPCMNGYQVMEALKLNRLNDDLAILVISAQIEQQGRSLAAGAEGFIGKPFDIVEINTRIRNLLKQSRLIKPH